MYWGIESGSQLPNPWVNSPEGLSCGLRVTQRSIRWFQIVSASTKTWIIIRGIRQSPIGFASNAEGQEKSRNENDFAQSFDIAAVQSKNLVPPPVPPSWFSFDCVRIHRKSLQPFPDQGLRTWQDDTHHCLHSGRLSYCWEIQVVSPEVAAANLILISEEQVQRQECTGELSRKTGKLPSSQFPSGTPLHFL